MGRTDRIAAVLGEIEGGFSTGDMLEINYQLRDVKRSGGAGGLDLMEKCRPTVLAYRL